MPRAIAGRRRAWKPVLLIALLALLFGSRIIANYVIEYQWWKELNQLPTWLDMLLYSIAPMTAGTLLTFAAFWTAHARAGRRASGRFSRME